MAPARPSRSATGPSPARLLPGVRTGPGKVTLSCIIHRHRGHLQRWLAPQSYGSEMLGGARLKILRVFRGKWPFWCTALCEEAGVRVYQVVTDPTFDDWHTQSGGMLSKTMRKAGAPQIMCVAFGCSIGVVLPTPTRDLPCLGYELLLTLKSLPGSELGGGWRSGGRERAASGPKPGRGVRLARSSRARAYLSPS